jgi:hypothetical protein
MGYHACEYLSREEAIERGLRHIGGFHSSGDVSLAFDNGRHWMVPDMALLYVELGWLPPRDFIDDIMSGTQIGMAAYQERFCPKDTTSAAKIAWYKGNVRAAGYLSPETDPLPRPFALHPALPAGFLERFEERMDAACKSGDRQMTMSASAPRFKR